MSAGTVVLVTYHTRMEAEMAAGLLKSAGIPSVVNSMEGMGLGPLPFGARLMVRAEDQGEARDVLGLEPDGDEEPDA